MWQTRCRFPVVRLSAMLLCWSLALSPTGGLKAGTLSARQIQEISSLAAETLTRDGLPGLSIAVAKDGHIWSAGFGKADLEQDVAVTGRCGHLQKPVSRGFRGEMVHGNRGFAAR